MIAALEDAVVVNLHIEYYLNYVALADIGSQSSVGLTPLGKD